MVILLTEELKKEILTNSFRHFFLNQPRNEFLEMLTALGEWRRVLHNSSFVLHQFIEHQPIWLNECQQYKTAYVELTLARPMV